MIRIILYTFFFSFFMGNTFVIQAQKKKKKADNQLVLVTPYELLFKGKAVHTQKGLMTIHNVKGQVLVEFPLRLLDKDMLLTSSIENISDNGEGIVGEFGGTSLPVHFIKIDSTLQARLSLIGKPITSEHEKNISQALLVSNKGGAFKTFKILAYTPDSSAVVINMSDFFMEHSYYTNPFPNHAANAMYGLVKRDHKFQEDHVFLKDIKAKGNNITVVYEVGYKVDHLFFGTKVSKKDQPLTATINKMLVLLPEYSMRLRYADPRMGVAHIRKQDFHDGGQGSKKTYFIKRWRLDPGDKDAYQKGHVVYPQKPITFYIDSLFPSTWQPYIKAGIEIWNDAFKQIGFKNAIQAKVFPKDKDFDANDFTVSTIRFAPSWMPTIEHSLHIDPRSGEILNASIYVNSGVVSQYYYSAVANLMASVPSVRAFQLPEKLLGQLLQAEITRNIGYCLGLTDNRGASYAYPVDSLRSAKFTQKYGLSPSIMDEVIFNYIAQPEDVEQGTILLQNGIGLCDVEMIKYAYTPLFDIPSPQEELPVLNQWIETAQLNSLYRYSKGQWYPVYDPTATRLDLGNNHIKAMQYCVANLKRSIPHVKDWFAEKDINWENRLKIYAEIEKLYLKRLEQVIANIGGLVVQDVVAENKRPAFYVVSKVEQKAALQYVLSLTRDITWLDKKDVQNIEDLKSAESYRIQEIYTKLLNRLKYVALAAEHSLDPYTPEEFVKDLYLHVFEGTIKGRKLTLEEIDLQQQFLGSIITTSSITEASSVFQTPTALINLYEVKPNWAFEEIPEIEAYKYPFSYYYYSLLSDTKALITKALTKADRQTRSHYEFLLFKINKAMHLKS